MAKTDAQVQTALLARRDAILDELAAMDATKAGGKPDSQSGGIGHVAYKLSLYEELAKIEETLAVYEDEGPFEVAIEGVT